MGKKESQRPHGYHEKHEEKGFTLRIEIDLTRQRQAERLIDLIPVFVAVGDIDEKDILDKVKLSMVKHKGQKDEKVTPINHMRLRK